MRFSARPAAACLSVSLYLATSSTTRAFVCPAGVAQRRALSSSWSRPEYARCDSAAPVRMLSTAENGRCPTPDHLNPPSSTPTRWHLTGTCAKLVTRGSGRRRRKYLSASLARRKQQARRMIAVFATAVVVRSSFQAQEAGAIAGMRSRSAQQQRLEKQRRQQKLAASREKLLEQTQESDRVTQTGEVVSEAEAVESSEGAPGRTGEGDILAQEAGDTGQDSTDAISGSTQKQPSQRVDSKADRFRGLQEDMGGRRRASSKVAPTKSKTKLGSVSAVAIGGFAIYNIMSSVKASSDIMGKQRRRVRVESAKFDQQKDEFMNVEGEAAIDVDMMKELRDMKEKVAGPGDKYAKETRKYNPAFAEEHPDDEYDAKVEEALRKTGKMGKKPKMGKTGIVFTNDEASQGSSKTPPEADSDDLLSDTAAGTNAVTARSESDRDEGEASAASRAKKEADVKRLQAMFDKSPSDEDGNSEEDPGDKRELLP